MKIHEIINEQKLGDIPLGHAEAAKGIHLFADPDGWDSDHHLERVMRAAAMADGSDDPIDVDNNSFVGKYSIAYPYTEVESRMMKQAFRALGSDTYSHQEHKPSQEQETVHKTSPTRQVGAITLKKK
jgi:hypothetical protein